MLTFGELGVLDLDLQLGEENVLSRVLAQVTREDLEGGRGEGVRLGEVIPARVSFQEPP